MTLLTKLTKVLYMDTKKDIRKITMTLKINAKTIVSTTIKARKSATQNLYTKTKQNNMF